MHEPENQCVCYKIVSLSSVREGASMKSQQHGCLHKAEVRTTPVDMLKWMRKAPEAPTIYQEPQATEELRIGKTVFPGRSIPIGYPMPDG